SENSQVRDRAGDQYAVDQYAADVASGVIALLGSGETAPGMVRVHRELLARYDAPRALLLDSTYGFQENVAQMTAKLVAFFATSLHVDLEVASLPRYDAATDLQRHLVRRQVARADYVFAGPGSPSYALSQWRPLPLGDDLADALARGATVCFASAAALTLGRHSAPIYEVYKAGADPTWLAGLDVLGRFGLPCAVIPHWDNAEGRDHDTSRCFLGERRLTLLEEDLPADVAILGIDEHTAVLLDLARDEVTTMGRGRAYWRRGGQVRELGPAPTPLAALRLGRRDDAPRPGTPPPMPDAPAALGEAAARGDLPALAELVRRASGAAGALAPELIEAVLMAREAARRAGDYALADRLRAGLEAAGVDVRDGVGGTVWAPRP
ncbi:MAG: CysS/YqeB C-terminal domain-containing protein, partial [Acidimicrobiales bacterium]